MNIISTPKKEKNNVNAAATSLSSIYLKSVYNPNK